MPGADAMYQSKLSKLYPAPCNYRGITLVELMISMSLGLFIVAGVLQMYVTASQNARISSGVMHIQDNMRYAMSRLEEDISQAGNAGCFSFMLDQRESNSGPLGAGVATEKNRIINMLADQTGNDDWNRAVSATNGVANAPDSLTLRYVSPLGQIPISGVDDHRKHFLVDTNDPTHADTFSRLKPFDIVVAASCTAAMVFMITNNPPRDGYIEFAPAKTSNAGQANRVLNADKDFFAKIVGRNGEPTGVIYAGHSGAYTYSIGKAASATGRCDIDNPQNCALLLNGRELLEGVHDLQLQFGRQFGGDVHPRLQFVAADADILTDDSLGWEAVDRIKMTIVLNSTDAVPTHRGTQLMTRTVTRVFTLVNQLTVLE